MFTLRRRDPAVPRLLARGLAAGAGRTWASPRSTCGPPPHRSPTTSTRATTSRQIKRLAPRSTASTPTGLTMYGKTQEEMRQRIQHGGRAGHPDTSSSTARSTTPTSSPRFLPPLLEDLRARRACRIAVENHLTVPFTADFESGGARGGALGRGRGHARPDQAAGHRHRLTVSRRLRRATPPVGDAARPISEVVTLPGRAQEAVLLLHLGHRPWPTSTARTAWTSGPASSSCRGPTARSTARSCSRNLAARGLRGGREPEVPRHARLATGRR